MTSEPELTPQPQQCAARSRRYREQRGGSSPPREEAFGDQPGEPVIADGDGVGIEAQWIGVRSHGDGVGVNARRLTRR